MREAVDLQLFGKRCIGAGRLRRLLSIMYRAVELLEEPVPVLDMAAHSVFCPGGVAGQHGLENLTVILDGLAQLPAPCMIKVCQREFS